MPSVDQMAEWCATALEAFGTGIITITAFYVLLFALYKAVKKVNADTIYREVRKLLGRGILLGLEFLVGADIIRTVAVELSFENVGALALVVAIRTFLSYTLEVELTGSWHWEKNNIN
ncbi:MAG: DUF1622 domain-containing protein [Balneolaceae bacterium]